MRMLLSLETEGFKAKNISIFQLNLERINKSDSK